MAQAAPQAKSTNAPKHIAKEITPEDRRFRELLGVWPLPPASMGGTVLGVLFRIVEAFEHARETLAGDRTQTALGKAMTLATKVPGVDKALADVRFGIESLGRKAEEADRALEAILGAAGDGRPADAIEAARHGEIRQALAALPDAERLAALRDASGDPETLRAIRSAPLLVRRRLADPAILDEIERAAVEAAVQAWLAERPELLRTDPRETKADAEHQIAELEAAIVHVENRIRPFRAPAAATEV